jgi:prolyl 4-hydroxylase
MRKTRKYVKHKGDLEIFTIPNFVSDKECDYLCSIIEANNTRSSVAGSGDINSTYHEGRTSSTSTLMDSDEIVNAINQRMHDELNIPLGYSEPTQGQIYQAGQEFRHHTDYFEGNTYNNHCLASGQRTWTFMIYLNNVEEGGETEFPNLNKKRFIPTKGTAVVWKNSEGSQKVYPDSLHAGLPVIKGKKIIITKWFRENVFNSDGDRILSQEHFKKNKPNHTLIPFKSHTELPKLTPNGFKVVPIPTNTWRLIQEAYNLLKAVKTEENWVGMEQFIHDSEGKKAEVEIFNMDHCFRIKEIILDELHDIHKEFAQKPIEPVCIYGIRSYKRGAILEPHVDTSATHHVSSIVVVDKQTDSDWALEIQDHDGEWHKIYANQGDMILYESAICKHGRKEPLDGDFYNNLFIHYKLAEYIYQV